MEVKKIGNLSDVQSQSRTVYDADGISPTLCSGMDHGNTMPYIVDKQIVAMRGRNPDNPSDRTVGSPTEQRLEPNSQGICNTLTSVQKDNMVLESKSVIIDDLYENRDARVYKDTAPALRSERNGLKTLETVKIENQYRIRKLTPRSCWRIMDFSDEDFHKAESVNSNTQLYRQSGNSIARNVLVAIFGQMISGKENVYKEI